MVHSRSLVGVAAILLVGLMALPAISAPEEQGPAFPTEASVLRPRNPDLLNIPAARPHREMQGPILKYSWSDVARIAAFDNPLVTYLRATIEATGTPRDESYNPTDDMGGGNFEFDPSFRAKAAFAQNRVEMDVLKRKYLRDERFYAAIVTPIVRSGSIAWAIIGAMLAGSLFALFSARRLLRRAAVKAAAYGLRAQSAITSVASGEAAKLRDEVRAEVARQSDIGTDHSSTKD